MDRDDNTQAAWEQPSDQQIERMTLITAQQLADAIRHLRATYPELARKWGLSSDRSKRPAKRTR